MQITKLMALVVVACVFLQVKGLPLINNSQQMTGTEQKADKFHHLEHWKSYHLFPHWVSEIGEIALFALDYVWHHEVTGHIQEVEDQVSEINGKLDALLATSPAASQLFFQLKKSSLAAAAADGWTVEDRDLKFADVSPGKPEIRWKKLTKADGKKIQNYY